MSIADLDFDDEERWFPRHFWRYAAWGGAATLAFALALAALASEQGSQRLAAAWRPPSEPADASSVLLAGRVGNAELETRRLSELVRLVSADRDRLLTRMASLEKTLDEMSGTLTGSVGPGAPARGAFIPGPNTAAPAAPFATAGRGPAAVTAPPAIQPPPTAPASGARVADGHAAAVDVSDSGTGKTAEFGIDIGGDTTVEGLRRMWTTLRNNHSALLEGLRPLMTIRESQKSLELRLVAGPLASAGVAARYCTALSVSGVACQPSPYEGQRLVAR